jgi:hypothetical protein
VSYGNDQDSVITKNERDIVGEAREVHAPESRRSLSPEKRMLDNSCANTLNLLAKPCAQARNPGLVIARDALQLGGRFGEKLENQAHRLGAICFSRANTSPAGMVRTSPASRRAMRRTILPRGLCTRLRLQVHAVEQSTGKCEPLIRREDKRIVGNGFECGCHEEPVNVFSSLSSRQAFTQPAR